MATTIKIQAIQTPFVVEVNYKFQPHHSRPIDCFSVKRVTLSDVKTHSCTAPHPKGLQDWTAVNCEVTFQGVTLEGSPIGDCTVSVGLSHQNHQWEEVSHDSLKKILIERASWKIIKMQ